MRTIEEIKNELESLGFFNRLESSNMFTYLVINSSMIYFYYVSLGYDYHFCYYCGPGEYMERGFNYWIDSNSDFKHCDGCDNMDISSVILLYKDVT